MTSLLLLWFWYSMVNSRFSSIPKHCNEWVNIFSWPFFSHIYSFRYIPDILVDFFFCFHDQIYQSIDRSIYDLMDLIENKNPIHTHPFIIWFLFFSFKILMDMNLEGKKYIVSFEVIQKLTVLLLLVVDDDDGHSLKKVI